MHTSYVYRSIIFTCAYIHPDTTHIKKENSSNSTEGGPKWGPDPPKPIPFAGDLSHPPSSTRHVCLFAGGWSAEPAEFIRNPTPFHHLRCFRLGPSHPVTLPDVNCSGFLHRWSPRFHRHPAPRHAFAQNPPVASFFAKPSRLCKTRPHRCPSEHVSL